MAYREGRFVVNGKTDGRTKKWAAKLKLETPKDIAKLPWLGNHYSDCELFNRCETFIRGLKNRKQQKEALYQMGLHGMGLKDRVTDEALDQWLAAVA